VTRQPFWETAYRAGGPDPFGSASSEVLELLSWVAPGASVLDLGCGAGRNAFPLARAGMNVTAVDVSQAACKRVSEIASASSLRINVVHQDLRIYNFTDQYEVIIAHGILHLLPVPDRILLLNQMKSHTSPNGINVLAVFTSRIAAPPDLESEFVGLFEEGELHDAYMGWTILLRSEYTLEDEHPGGIRHQHPVNKIVARNSERASIAV